jgi:hypothetical protein
MNMIWTTGDDGDRYMIQCNTCERMWFSPPVDDAIDRFGWSLEEAEKKTEEEMVKIIGSICEHVR